MKFYNEHEIQESVRLFNDADTPNYFTAALALARLSGWANQNSDGWAYWPKPARSAKRLMEALDKGKAEYLRGGQPTDLTAAQLKSVLVPVKAFLTREGASAPYVLGL